MRNSQKVSLRCVFVVLVAVVGLLAMNGCGSGTAAPAVTLPTVTISANPTQVAGGSSTTLTVVASNATSVAITDNTDSISYPLPAGGGTQKVTPGATTIYTATATGSSGTNTATVTVTVARTAGLTYANKSNTFPVGDITQANANVGATVRYTYTLVGGKTPAAGTYEVVANWNLTGTAHASTGDTYAINVTAGGVAQVINGAF